MAELWYGAHGSAPSLFADGLSLAERIAANPDGELGKRAVARFGPELPYLVKLLSAEHPLSLQVHPDSAQARNGYAAELAAGEGLQPTARVYQDNNHKPETLLALSDFHALVGFRQSHRTVALFDALETRSLRTYRNTLALRPGSDGIRATYVSFMTMNGSQRRELISELSRASDRYQERHGIEGEWTSEVATILDLASRYESDIGVLAATLLNRVTLRPGEAIYVEPGQLHTYLKGTGLEVMANSDNVIRGGLTNKNTNISLILEVATFKPISSPIIRPVRLSGRAPEEILYPAPADDFKLSALRVDRNGSPIHYKPAGPEILVCTSGSTTVKQGGCSETLGPGEALWIPNSTNELELKSDRGAIIFRAGIGCYCSTG